ncbi:MAG: ankyrin repeat domain-containing protein [Treponemataceae bacterium]|nr:ankyrin repeat domain-containing protein [Treponemataceae bacterium]
MNKMKKSVIVALLATLCSAAWATSLEELLIQAVKTSDMNILQGALQWANPNYTDASGKTALMYACENGWYAGVVTLLEKGAQVEIKNKADGKTALMYAVQSVNTMIVQKLIEAMANINAKDFDGKTALMYAIESNNNRVANFLLKLGADCLATDNYGNTIALYAVKHKNRMLLRELVGNFLIDWNKTNNEGISPLALACMDGDLNIINQLLQEAPIEISASHIDGQSIIIWLIANRKSPAIIEYLVNFCNPEEIRSMTDVEGHDIKYWAEKQGYKNILIRLYEIEEKESRRDRAYSKHR